MTVTATNDDDAALARTLTGWLRRALERPSLIVAGLSRPKAGTSNETVIVAVWWDDGGARRDERLVVRIQPTGRQLFLRPDTIGEGRVLRAIAAAAPAAVPVPRVLAFEPDAGVVGSPFFVMSHVPGRVLSDIPSCHTTGWLLDETPAQRAALWDSGLRTLVDIGRIPVSGDLAFLWAPALGTTGLRQLVTATRHWFDWVRGERELDVLGRAMGHVERECPDHDDRTLSWGDARVGNMMFAPDGTVAAVLDWETPAVGPAEVDLGWWLMMDEFYSHGLGTPPLPGVPDEATQIARWEELIGRPTRDLTYYKLLAALRFAIVCARSTDISIARGVARPDTTLHIRNPAGLLLYRWLGEPVPDLAPEFTAMMARFVRKRAGRTG
ncbi:phosphotransferase family protein [Candidatus Frankia alpina]|uniref:phosphotransferase family protein n=1 Tax=Candidatus Frankia alpina TaxID=2699483 RepID=UPI0013D7C699|nr:phosphotransferase family protein [Candidatus Frankia alpina]